MHRNFQSCSDMVRYAHTEDKPMRAEIKNISEEVKFLRKEMSHYLFHKKLSFVNITKYFPIQNDEDLAAFLRKDCEWENRCKSFYDYLYTTVSEKKYPFGSTLLHALFSRKFIRDHNWPVKGYKNYVTRVVWCSVSIYYIFSEVIGQGPWLSTITSFPS